MSETIIALCKVISNLNKELEKIDNYNSELEQENKKLRLIIQEIKGEKPNE